jgi:1-aminocyclopropane-1-carboxylate deaminase/D-cysteine desulfhydrase-like pyridoxal-dependent ACC family enzyme
MQLASNEEKEIRGRYGDEIDYHYHCHDNDSISKKKDCQKGKRRRTHVRTSLKCAFHTLQHPRLSNRSIPKKFLRAVFCIAVFLLVERPLLCPRNKNAISRTFSLEMVLSFSITAVPQQARSRTILQLFRGTKPTTRNSFRLSSDLDGFFEKGGDMDRLVEELSGQQRRNSTHSVSNIPDRNGWRDEQDLTPVEKRNEKLSSPSPVEELAIRGRRVYVKHDDQLRLQGSGISGNKARKMWTLNEIPAESFPACLVSYGGPQSNSMLALAAVANFKNRELLGPGTLEDSRDEEPHLDVDSEDNEEDSPTNRLELPVRFVYYTKKLPRFLRKQPNGNFFRAISLGMELVEVSREEYGDLFEHRSDGSEGTGKPPMGLEAPCPDSLWVPQGGAFAPARAGNQQLAQEIYEYWLKDGKNRPLTVCVPGGTCTTALLLHHGLKQLLSQSDGKDNYDGIDCENNNGDSSHPSSSAKTMDIEVVVVPCVGDAAYARRQMMSLAAQIGASPDDIPTILQAEAEEAQERQSTSPRTSVVGAGTSSPKRKKYFSFGKPNKTILDTFQELQDDCSLLVDLIYGAPSFAIMFRHWGKGGDKKTSFLSPDLSFDPNQPLAGREIMYVHSGGLEGITSQMLRYKYDGLVEIKDVQLPGRKNRSKPQKRTKKHQ